MVSVHSDDRSMLERSVFESEIIKQMGILKKRARFLTKSEAHADDLVQDTLVKALLNRHQFTPGTNIVAWLLTILRNTHYSKSRKSKREEYLEPIEWENFADRRIDLEKEEEEAIIYDFLRVVHLLPHLNPEFRDAIVATHYIGMTYEEASLHLDVAVGTIKSRINRAIEILQRLLREGENKSFDFSIWAHATRDIPKNHSYFPIARAYEEIYASIRANPRPQVLTTTTQVREISERELDKAWRMLEASGTLEEEGDLGSLFLSEY